MSKFNVGDVVVRTHSYHAGMRVGDKATVAEVVCNTVKLVEYPQSRHDVANLEVVPDTRLPPAPTSVTYNVATDMNTLTVKQSAGGGRVYIGFKGHLVATLLDADDALQLCHDLRRMAMDIKRKEKQG
jgi:hypothetical protein